MEEGGLLESRANEAGRFLLCSVVDLESKRYCLVFPKGKGILGDGSCWLKSFVSLVFCLGMSLGELLLPMGQGV